MEQTRRLNETIPDVVRISDSIMVGNEYLSDIKVDVANSYISDAFIVRIDAFITARKLPKQTVTILTRRPTFIEWLLRKPIVVKVEVDCMEVMKNPSKKMNDSVFLYDAR